MKRGFTLVEMLIVVVVLVTLMTITFRLAGLGSNSSSRTLTISRLQKLENCLSGYYAAFGTYPPVRLHGSRNYKLKTSSHGIQNLDGQEEDPKWNWFDTAKHAIKKGGGTAESRDWRQVRAACKSQPVDCRYPYPYGNGNGYNEFIKAVSRELANGASGHDLSDERKQVLSAGFDDGVTDGLGRFGSYRRKSEWREVQLFKFGLMSFLLPRYLIMMDSAPELYRNYEQWNGNNSLPSDPLTGQKFNNWQQVQDKSRSDDQTEIASIANIPSQAVCARWIPNLENACHCNHAFTLFGVSIRDGAESDLTISDGAYSNLEIFSPGGFDNDAASGQYVLDGVTIRDGWQNEFYYYSPAPHQSYVLWSAGPNGRTFPPWVPRESLNANANACVGYWTEDDIVNMSH